MLRRPTFLLCGVVVGLIGGVLDAQQPSRAPISGSVRDSSGAAIAGAEITVLGTSVRGESGDDGTFHLAALSTDTATLRVRRLGFKPLTVPVQGDPAGTATVNVRLVALPQSLEPVVVMGGQGNGGPDRLQGFSDRRHMGVGRFFTHEDIERQKLQHLSDIMRLVPGANIERHSYPENAVRLRGASCAPLVWLDGFPLMAGEFDLDALQPSSIEAMEIYPGPASVPLRFKGPLSVPQCGAIVIWSRQGQPRQRSASSAAVAAELAKLVDEQRVYTADQVDTPARSTSAVTTSPAYPDSLFRQHVGGIVVAEFVVDQSGDVSMDQFNVVSSTSPAFSDAVREALPRAKFVPAQRQGRSVKQVVELTFRFVAETKR